MQEDVCFDTEEKEGIQMPEDHQPTEDAGQEDHQGAHDVKQERRDFVKILATRLNETEPAVLLQLHLIVKILGIEKTRQVLQETIDKEEQGGMLVVDGSRRRTIGGVFLFLVKETYWKQLPASFWPRKPASNPPPSQPSHEPVRPWRWEDRLNDVQELQQEKGPATVKITLVGRPRNVLERGTCVVMSMTDTKMPSLPGGLPQPPEEVGKTLYMVYISMKQWKKVATVLQDEDDTLILEGYPQLDGETKSIVVFVTSAKTKKTEQAKKVKPE